MAQSSTERQRAFRDRQVRRISVLESEVAGLRRDLDAASGGLAAASTEIERLEAELSAGPAARCPQCRGELACPRCYRSGDF